MAARRTSGKRGGGGGGGGRQGLGKELGKQTREGRVGVAQETLDILDSGSFTSPGGVVVDISEDLSQSCNQVQMSLQRSSKYKHFTFYRPPFGLPSSWRGEMV